MAETNVNVQVGGPNNPASIYKTVVLKGNQSFASQVTKTRTKYVIKYNFNLNGAIVIIPAKCLIEFDGGSLSNGTIIGQNTDIQAGLFKIFNTDIALDGTWNVAEAYPEWFGAKGDGVIDDAESIIKCLTTPVPIIAFNNKYKTSQSLYIGNKSIKGKSANASSIIYTGNNTAVYFGCYTDNVFTGLYIRDISIECNDDSQCAIHIQNVWRCSFDDIAIKKVQSGIGIKTYSTANNGFYWNSFRNCHFSSINRGLVFDSDRTQGASNANSVIACDFHTVVNAIEVLFGDAIVIDSCAFEFVSGSAVKTDCKSTKIVNNRFEQTNYDLEFMENCQYQFVQGNFTTGSQLWIIDNAAHKNSYDTSKCNVRTPNNSKTITTHTEANAKVDDMVMSLGNEFGAKKKSVLLMVFSPVQCSTADTVWIQIRAGNAIISETTYKFNEAGIQNVALMTIASPDVISSNPQEYSVYCWSNTTGTTITMGSKRIFYAQCLNNGVN